MTINSTSRPPERDWSFIVVHVAGHGIAGDIADNLRVMDKAGTSPDAYVTVRAEQDDHVTDFTLTQSGQPGGHLQPIAGGFDRVPSSEHPITGAQELKDFLVDAARRFPARHYYVSFDGHSRQLRQVIPQLHEGMKALTEAIGHKADVLSFDSCFMGQLETASEFKDVAHNLVASQDFIRGSSPVTDLARQVSEHPMEGADVARAVVASRVGKEPTACAYNLDQTDRVNQAMAALGEEIRKVKDEAALHFIRKDFRSSQHFYTIGVVHPNPYHSTVDLGDAMAHLAGDRALAKRAPEVVQKAAAVGQTLHDSGFVLGEQHQPKVTHTFALDLRDDRHAQGVSLHCPTTVASPLRSHYTHFQNSQFEKETHWDEAISALTHGNEAYRIDSRLRDLGGLSLWGLSLALDDVQEHWDQLRHPARLFSPSENQPGA